MIVKINGDTNNKKYFVMFNRAKGVNSGTLANIDEVVITEQSGASEVSWHMAGLGEGSIWYKNNFGAPGQTLVVKHCYSVFDGSRDKAKVLIYI